MPFSSNWKSGVIFVVIILSTFRYYSRRIISSVHECYHLSFSFLLPFVYLIREASNNKNKLAITFFLSLEKRCFKRILLQFKKMYFNNTWTLVFICTRLQKSLSKLLKCKITNKFGLLLQFAFSLRNSIELNIEKSKWEFWVMFTRIQAIWELNSSRVFRIICEEPYLFTFYLSISSAQGQKKVDQNELKIGVQLKPPSSRIKMSGTSWLFLFNYFGLNKFAETSLWKMSRQTIIGQNLLLCGSYKFNKQSSQSDMKTSQTNMYVSLSDADQLFFDSLDVIQIAADCLSHFERWLVGVCVEYT
jgi:hypothetical protein